MASQLILLVEQSMAVLSLSVPVTCALCNPVQMEERVSFKLVDSDVPAPWVIQEKPVTLVSLLESLQLHRHWSSNTPCFQAPIHNLLSTMGLIFLLIFLSTYSNYM